MVSASDDQVPEQNQRTPKMKMYYDVYNAFSEKGTDYPPIVFLHGLLDTRKTWKKVAPVIAKRTNRKAYAPDVRNHGESPWSDEKMNFDNLTQDVLEFLDEHGIKTAIIVGHSLGGRTAINFALKYPDRTDALIVEDMTTRNIRSGNSSLVSHALNIGKDFLDSVPSDMDINDIKLQIVELMLSVVTEKFYTRSKLPEKQYLLEMIPVKKVGDKFEAECNLEAAKSMLLSDPLVQNLPEGNATYNGDTLFVHGGKGFYNVDKDSSIKKVFPRAVLRKVEGASHYIHFDSADEFVDILSEFILQRNVTPAKY